MTCRRPSFASTASFAGLIAFASICSAQELAPLSGAPEPYEITQPEAANDGRQSTLEALLASATFAVRVSADLGLGITSHVSADGVATAVILDGAPTLVTSWAYLSNADRIEVWADNRWIPAQMEHASLQDDLAVLVVEGFAPTGAVSLATAWPTGTQSFALAPIFPGGSAPELYEVSFGRRPRGSFSSYLRAQTVLTNGYPLLNADGTLAAICSFAAPDRAGGSLVIPWDSIAAWREKWPRLVDPYTLVAPVLEEELQLDVDPQRLAE